MMIRMDVNVDRVSFAGDKPRVEDESWGIDNLCAKHAFLLRGKNTTV